MGHIRRYHHEPCSTTKIRQKYSSFKVVAENEVILDSADGLTGSALHKSDFIHQVQTYELDHFRGYATKVRRKAIISTMMPGNDWTGW